MYSNFPHFTRKFTANPIRSFYSFTRWSLFTILLIINLLATRSSSPIFGSQQIMVQRQPFSPMPHIDLASSYWKNGFHDLARNEIFIAQELINRQAQLSSSPILGINTKPLEFLSSWEGEVKRLKEELSFWQTVVNQKPLYRDAYITIASIAYQLGQVDQAKSSIEQAKKLGMDSDLLLKFNHLLNSQ